MCCKLSLSATAGLERLVLSQCHKLYTLALTGYHQADKDCRIYHYRQLTSYLEVRFECTSGPKGSVVLPDGRRWQTQNGPLLKNLGKMVNCPSPAITTLGEVLCFRLELAATTQSYCHAGTLRKELVSCSSDRRSTVQPAVQSDFRMSQHLDFWAALHTVHWLRVVHQ